METMTSRKCTLVKEWLLVNLIVGCKLLRDVTKVSRFSRPSVHIMKMSSIYRHMA